MFVKLILTTILVQTNTAFYDWLERKILWLFSLCFSHCLFCFLALPLSSSASRDIHVMGKINLLLQVSTFLKKMLFVHMLVLTTVKSFSTRKFIHLSIHTSVCPPIHSSVRISILLSVHNPALCTRVKMVKRPELLCTMR